MRTKFTILTGCAVVFFSGSICGAADFASESAEISTTQVVSAPADLGGQQMRSKINSIKPAAGSKKRTATIVRKEYWQQTVNRKRHKALRE